MPLMVVTLEVSKLSGWLNADAYCRVERRACTVRREVCGSAGGGAADDHGARSVQARARRRIWGRARGGAHKEHAGHVRDAGGVEAQRLVER